MALNLKFSDIKRPTALEKRKKNPRSVVLEGIAHQLELLKNPKFTVTRDRYLTVIEDGVKKKVKKSVAGTPRPWFWVGEDGSMLLQVKYGSSTVIELEPGKPTVVAGRSEKDVEKVLVTIQKAVEAGDLDPQIMVAKEKAKRGKGE
jgi:hypothetical protein